MDLRNPGWLEEPIPFVDSSMSDNAIVDELMKDPEVLRKFLCDITVSMSNRQVRETSDLAARWVRDINKCEETEGLDDNLKSIRKAAQLVLQLMHNVRGARNVFSVTGNKFRRQ